ncbi:MAG TPA: FlgD immunoglobulin-like domain containing protein, partial [Candidatus Eisenbacteria bacterium]|nr:FlgD immunoglobulin-like domain containing protein [Candidatus Eisenbacteria bacterium]
LRVFRVNGTLVRTLHDGPGAPGPVSFTWDGRDDRGAAVSGGVYLIELRSGNRTRIEKAVLLR